MPLPPARSQRPTTYQEFLDWYAPVYGAWKRLRVAATPASKRAYQAAWDGLRELYAEQAAHWEPWSVHFPAHQSPEWPDGVELAVERQANGDLWLVFPPCERSWEEIQATLTGWLTSGWRPDAVHALAPGIAREQTHARR